jgi:alpha,alpha-trehalose phosphorylase
MGGTWMAIVHGFAGFRDYDGRFTFDPALPPGIKRLRFPLTIRGARLRADIEPQRASFSLEEGDEIRLECRGKEVHLCEDRRTAVVPYDEGSQAGAKRSASSVTRKKVPSV